MLDHWWKTTGETVGLKWVKGGIGLITSADRLHFQLALPQPLILTEPGDWSRKNGLELISYPDLIDARTGLNQLDDHWLLAYMYLNPGDRRPLRPLGYLHRRGNGPCQHPV